MDEDFHLQDWVVIVNETDCGDDVFFENSANPVLVDSDQESDGSISIISYPPTNSPSEEEHASSIEPHHEELPCVATSSSQTYVLKSLDENKAIIGKAQETPDNVDDFKDPSSLHTPASCNEDLTLHKEIVDYHEELMSRQKPTLHIVSAQDEESIFHIESNSKGKENSMPIEKPILSEDLLLVPYKPPIFYGATILDKETDSARKLLTCKNAVLQKEIAQIKFAQDDQSTKSTSEPVIYEELFLNKISLFDEELPLQEEHIQHPGSVVPDKTNPDIKVDSDEEVIYLKDSSITMKSNSEKQLFFKTTSTKQSQPTLKELIQQGKSAPERLINHGDFILEPYGFPGFSSIPNSELSPAFEESADREPALDEKPIVYKDFILSRRSIQDEIEIPNEDPATKKLVSNKISNTYQDSSKKCESFLCKDSGLNKKEIMVIPREESLAPMDLVSDKTTTSHQLEELTLDANSLVHQQPNEDLFMQKKIISQEKPILKEQSTLQAGSPPDEISKAKHKASNASKSSLPDETSSQEVINLDHSFPTAKNGKWSSTENHDNVITRTSLTQLGKDKTLAKISLVLMSTVCVISCCMYAYTLQSDTKLSRCLSALSSPYYRGKDTPQERINSGLVKHTRHKQILEDGFARNSRGSYFLGLKHNIKSVFDTQNKYDLSHFKCHQGKMRKTNRNKSKKKNIRPEVEWDHFGMNYEHPIDHTIKRPPRKIRHLSRKK